MNEHESVRFALVIAILALVGVILFWAVILVVVLFAGGSSVVTVANGASTIAATSSFKDGVAIIASLIGIISALAVWALAWLLYGNLAPHVDLQLLSRPLEGSKTCILTIRVTNTSKVRVYKKSLVLLVRFYKKPDDIEALTEWVEFGEKCTHGEPEGERRSFVIMDKSEVFYPGGTASVDFPVTFPEKASFAHVGLQVELRPFSWIGAKARGAKQNERWTTTMFVWAPKV